MSAAKHTAEPWQVIVTKFRTLIVSVTGERIAECEQVSEANARLIAAAPELLEALQKLDEARGHTFHKPAGQKGFGAVVIPRELFDSLVSAAIAKATGSAP